MSFDNSQEKIPTVWAEDGNPTSHLDLSDGHLVEIRLYSPQYPNSSKTIFLGLYRGIKKSDCGSQLVLQIAGERLIADTVGRLCESRSEEFALKNVMLVHILARNSYAALVLFHALGVSEVYRKNAENRIKQAEACLKDLSGLNLLGW